jgi:hypothetical protein
MAPNSLVPVVCDGLQIGILDARDLLILTRKRSTGEEVLLTACDFEREAGRGSCRKWRVGRGLLRLLRRAPPCRAFGFAPRPAPRWHHPGLRPQFDLVDTSHTPGVDPALLQSTIKVWDPWQGKVVDSLGPWSRANGLVLPGYTKPSLGAGGSGGGGTRSRPARRQPRREQVAALRLLEPLIAAALGVVPPAPAASPRTGRRVAQPERAPSSPAPALSAATAPPAQERLAQGQEADSADAAARPARKPLLPDVQPTAQGPQQQLDAALQLQALQQLDAQLQLQQQLLEQRILQQLQLQQLEQQVGGGAAPGSALEEQLSFSEQLLGVLQGEPAPGAHQLPRLQQRCSHGQRQLSRSISGASLLSSMPLGGSSGLWTTPQRQPAGPALEALDHAAAAGDSPPTADGAATPAASAAASPAALLATSLAARSAACPAAAPAAPLAAPVLPGAEPLQPSDAPAGWIRLEGGLLLDQEALCQVVAQYFKGWQEVRQPGAAAPAGCRHHPARLCCANACTDQLLAPGPSAAAMQIPLSLEPRGRVACLPRQRHQCRLLPHATIMQVEALDTWELLADWLGLAPGRGRELRQALPAALLQPAAAATAASVHCCPPAWRQQPGVMAEGQGSVVRRADMRLQLQQLVRLGPPVRSQAALGSRAASPGVPATGPQAARPSPGADELQSLGELLTHGA